MLGSWVRILGHAIFFKPEKPGFQDVFVKNKHQIRFSRLRITHFCSRSPDFVLFSQSVFRTSHFPTLPVHFSRHPLYLRPRQNKLSLNFRWGSEWVNGLFEHVFATKLAGNAPWGTKWPPYSLGVKPFPWNDIYNFYRIIRLKNVDLWVQMF